MTFGRAAVSIVVVVLAAGATACGAPGADAGVMPAPAPAPGATGPFTLRAPEMVPVDPELGQELDGSERLSMPPVEHDVAAAAQLLTELTAGRPEAGPVALDEAGPGVLLHWFGDPPAEVLETVAQNYPDIEVRVVPTARSGEDMAAIQQQVLGDFSSRGVGCVSAAPDASSLDICLDHQLDEDDRLTVVDDVEAATGLPVTVLPGGNPIPVLGAP